MLCAAAVVCPAGLSESSSGKLYPDCIVTEVLSVHSADSFTCRVAGWESVGPVRLRVQIDGIELSEGQTGSDGLQGQKAGSQRFTETRLKAAGSIKLKNVQMRNYFRVAADVFIDGNSLADELVNAGFANAVVPAVQVAETAPDRRIGHGIGWWRKQDKRGGIKAPGRDAGMRGLGRAAPHPGQPRSHKRYVTLAGLMKIKMDLSGLRADMGFHEAMDYIGSRTDPPLPIVVMWSDIEENGFISRDKPIGVDGFGAMELGRGLELVLRSVSAGPAGELEYVVQGGAITVAIKEMGLSRMAYQQVYDVSELAHKAWDFMQATRFLSGNQNNSPSQNTTPAQR